jgi:prepilin-type N-terminal cleavage/methylation domain-containing protein
MNNRKKNKGFTLLELAIVLVIGAMITASTYYLKAEEWKAEQEAKVGDDLRVVSDGVSRYMLKHGIELLKDKSTPTTLNVDITPPGVTYTSTRIINAALAPTLQDLKGIGLLSSNVPEESTRYGFKYKVKINRQTSDTSGDCYEANPGCHLSALVYTDQGLTVGRATPSPSTLDIDRVALGRIMDRAVNKKLLWSTKSSNLKLEDAGGPAKAVVLNPVPNTIGIIAVRLDNSDVADYDRRYLKLDGSSPMEGDLQMGSKNIIGVKNVSAAGNILTSGGSIYTANELIGKSATIAALNFPAATSSAPFLPTISGTAAAKIASNGSIFSANEIRGTSATIGKTDFTNPAIPVSVAGMTYATIASTGAISSEKSLTVKKGVVILGKEPGGAGLWVDGGAAIHGAYDAGIKNGAVVSSINGLTVFDGVFNTKNRANLESGVLIKPEFPQLPALVVQGSSSFEKGEVRIKGMNANENSLVLDNGRFQAFDGATIRGGTSNGNKGLVVTEGISIQGGGAAIQGNVNVVGTVTATNFIGTMARNCTYRTIAISIPVCRQVLYARPYQVDQTCEYFGDTTTRYITVCD